MSSKEDLAPEAVAAISPLRDRRESEAIVVFEELLDVSCL